MLLNSESTTFNWPSINRKIGFTIVPGSTSLFKIITSLITDGGFIQQLSDILAELALDPVMFVETMLQVKPEKWQREFLQNVMQNPRCAVKSGHGVGKPAVLSWLILWWIFTRHPCKVVCTANTAHQLSDVLWAEAQNGQDVCLRAFIRKWI